MKQLTAFVFFVLSIAACAQRSDGTGGPVCGNGTCQNGETAQSCPADCTTTSCNNNGTCDAGEDHGSCPNDCSADEQPPTGSDSWVCRGSFRGGKAYFSCNPTYIAGAPSTVDFVGECPALGLTGYYGANGHHISVSLNDMSVYEVEVPASATPGVACELTYAYKNSSGVIVWAQFGPNNVSQAVAGNYRECGTRNNIYACGMFFKPVAGHMPAPLGYYPN